MVKPFFMKSHWNDMPMKGGAKKRGKDSNKVKHVEDPDQTLVYVFLLDEDKIVQPYPPPSTHEDEESVDKEDFYEVHRVEDPVEVSLHFFLLAHEDKEMVNFSHTNDLMKEPLDVVDEHIETFIHIRRRRWDMGCFVFNEDPIYNIKGTFQLKSTQISPLEDFFAPIGDPYIW
jgi:hypothetical protein